MRTSALLALGGQNLCHGCRTRYTYTETDQQRPLLQSTQGVSPLVSVLGSSQPARICSRVLGGPIPKNCRKLGFPTPSLEPLRVQACPLTGVFRLVEPPPLQRSAPNSTRKPVGWLQSSDMSCPSEGDTNAQRRQGGAMRQEGGPTLSLHSSPPVTYLLKRVLPKADHPGEGPGCPGIKMIPLCFCCRPSLSTPQHRTPQHCCR